MKKAHPSLVDDAHGVARLAIDGVMGITDIVEQLHAAIGSAAAPIGPSAPVPTGGIAGFVYRRVRDVTRGVGWSIDTAFWPFKGALRVQIREREHLRAALNGVLGDRLAKAGNPLAIRMRLAADDAAPTGRIAVFVHGLCMHDGQWQRGPGSMDAAVRALGYSPVYLRYNSGLAVSDNGEAFSGHLDQLVASWPRRVTRLAIVGHSMGGLVARHACVHAQEDARPWLRRLRTLVFLGTPHLGSQLERTGTSMDFALNMSPYSAPFARLGGMRSRGIRDLGKDSSALPLPSGVACLAVAGRLTRASDGLVTLESALGLPLRPEQQYVIDGAGHIALMDHGEAVAVVRDALATKRGVQRQRGD